MKIAIVAKLFAPAAEASIGGQETFVYYLAKELASRGNDVTVFASGDSKIEKAKLIPIIKESVWSKIKDLSPEKQAIITRNAGGQWDGYYRVLEYLKDHEDEFDIIHDNAGTAGTMFMSKLLDKPVVTTMHLTALQIKKTLDQFNSSNYFVAISKRQKEMCDGIKVFDFNYNGIDEDKFSFNENGGDYLAWAGRISPEKGLGKAIEIANKAHKQLKIIGSLQNKNYFETKIKPKLDSSENIKYIGKLVDKELVEFYQNAKALLFPINWEEPFGLVMTEAMSCGTPIIAFKKGSVPEIVKTGKTGYVCRPRHVSSMVKAVKRIYDLSPEDYREMRLNCRKRVEEKFTISKMAEGYEEIYKKAIKKYKHDHKNKQRKT